MAIVAPEARQPCPELIKGSNTGDRDPKCGRPGIFKFKYNQ
jgi:hypothetical protein